MKRIFLLILAAGSLAAAVLDAAPKDNPAVISVRDYGAIPDDGKDDTKALRKAAEYCRKNPGTTLDIPAGVYRLRDAEAEKLEMDVMSGKHGPNPEHAMFVPYLSYVSGLDFSGSRDITIRAEGATLMCEGWMEPLSIIDCTNMTVEGLTIDYKRKPFSEGHVVAMTDTTITIRFRPECRITEDTPMPRLTFWDDSIGGIFPYTRWGNDRETLGDNLILFHTELPEHMIGAPVAASHCFHYRPGILILRSANTVLDGVTIHAQCGMGIVGFDSRDIMIKGLSVIPADGYSFSTNTDATHFACCEGLLSFDGCMFRGQGDDATNVHGYYQNITAVEDGLITLELQGMNTHALVTDVPRIGDRMEIVRISTLEVVGEAAVTEVSHRIPDSEVHIRIDGELPENFGDYYMFNATKLPKLEFRNSIVWGNRARAVLVKTRDVVIEDNYFRGCTGTAIHVGAESWWKEGTFTRNLRISRNIMINCGLGDGVQYGASGIAVVVEAPDIENTKLHDGVTIDGNIIIGNGTNDCGIAVYNSKNIVLKDNITKGCREGVVTHSVENLKMK